MIVTPDTVLRWQQRRRFREDWTQLSGGSTGGRPRVNAEIRALITRMATANPLWGPPRIHGELLKLGIDVAERTVSRLMPKRRPQPSQPWRTFLANHVRDLVSIDFFTVPAVRLHVLFVLAHHRRRVVHFNVTEHPTAVWTAEQIVDAFPGDSAPATCPAAGSVKPAGVSGISTRTGTLIAPTRPSSRGYEARVPRGWRGRTGRSRRHPPRGHATGKPQAR